MNQKKAMELFRTICEMACECLEARRLSSCSNDKAQLAEIREFSASLEKFKEAFQALIEERDALERQVARLQGCGKIEGDYVCTHDFELYTMRNQIAEIIKAKLHP